MKFGITSKSMLLLLPLLAACSGEDGAGSTAAVSQLGTAVAAQSATTTPIATPAPLGGFDAWSKRLMADRVSPVVAAAGDMSQAWAGADGRATNVVVRVPRTVGKPTVTIKAPAANGDATPVFQAALAQLKKAGGGILKVTPGDYRFKTASTELPSYGSIFLMNATDIDIQASGATFIFSQDIDGIYIQDSERVRIHGARMRDERVLSGTGRMRLVGGVMRLVLDQPLPAGATINWVQPMNEGTTRSWPQTLSRAIISPDMAQPVAIDDRNFTAPIFKNLKDGQYVALKYTYYGARAIYVRDSFKGTSNDIVLDGIRIGSTGGMGILVKMRGRGFAVQNSTIAADEGRPYSTNFDGLHIVGATGDILIRGNSFAHTGDDQINLSSIIHRATPVGNSVTLTKNARLVRVGDEVAFFNKDGEYVGQRTIASAPPIGSSDTVTFGLKPGEPIDTAAYARTINLTPRRFAIVNNTFADSAGRGILIQIANGLIQNNKFRSLPRTAIRMLTSFDPWLEGAGAINVRVTGNTIENGGAELGYSYVTGIIMAMGEVASTQVSATMQNGPIKVDNNKFIAPRAACVALYSTKGAVQQKNDCGGA